jgi:malonyl-ACP decarboxylase
MAREVAITGIGVTSAVGQGRVAFADNLLAGRQVFDVMKRAGRQINGSQFLGAELGTMNIPEGLATKPFRTASLSAQVAAVTLHEAWQDAKLDEVEPSRVGLVIGGSNFQQRELTLLHDSHAGREQYLRPSYAFSFMDTDLCGFCTEQFPIRGFAHTIGGASASGQLAVLQAIQSVITGQVDVCVAMGALMDLSYWECHAMRSLGAMGSDRYAASPQSACRPFDRLRDGFIFGECCGALVVERPETRRTRRYGLISGWATAIDGNRNPNPSLQGEVEVIKRALQMGRLSPEEIDYVNPHGSGSTLGDQTELEALRACALEHAYINSTKSIVGHGLSAAGTVEVVATLLQMRASSLHPSLNLDAPADDNFNWVGPRAVKHEMVNALTLSFGFGGVNTALCLRRADN